MMPNKLLINFLGKPGLPEWIIRTGITTNSRILDIGCGDGSLLFQMREMGFKNLTGVDRYINFENVQYKRIKFFNKDISALSYSAKPAFDLVMLHHSFEHMRGQFETLNHIKNLLSDHGSVVIRIPVVPSFAWRKYGTNWFALDAPRHFFLHTEHSMQLVAEKTGFTIMNRYCDASPQTLWASEQYTKNIPFMDDRSLRFGLDKSIFTKKDLEGFVAKAQELNKSQDGDTACFILKKK
ncbi:MAG: class I SAM-dependent methyltransferase [Desulfobacteraceae bacterium]|nr:class I SAM-dependent methyltransferase [Desulfobacteraceae bacterium]MBC2757649.1 class I SAM-dependent methyltransferase [Desulfobacteraceae bacterium]MBC2763894.1 class I SAM-dependent methyltransferase [ANME-2 cluster archaeon]